MMGCLDANRRCVAMDEMSVQKLLLLHWFRRLIAATRQWCSG